MDQTEEIDALARKYLDLWVEYWASCLNSTESAAFVAKLFGSDGPRGDAVAMGGRDGSHPPDPGAKPAALRTAPDPGGERADELESRIAELERRLAKLEGLAGDGPAGPPAGPRRKPRAV